MVPILGVHREEVQHPLRRYEDGTRTTTKIDKDNIKVRLSLSPRDCSFLSI